MILTVLSRACRGASGPPSHCATAAISQFSMLPPRWVSVSLQQGSCLHERESRSVERCRRFREVSHEG